MILVDAGPLVAVFDRSDSDHSRCVAALSGFGERLVTSWPALSEAMYLLGEIGGWVPQRALWNLVFRKVLEIATIEDIHLRRVRDFMHKYQDLPMDLADATLVVVAEERGINRIFTLDKHFRVYRLHGRQAFEIVP